MRLRWVSTPRHGAPIQAPRPAVLVAFALGGALALLAPAAHAKGDGDPMAKLRRTDAELRAAINQRIPDWSPEAPVRKLRIDRLLRGLLDYHEIARRALGPSFSKLPAQQQSAFVATFSELTGQTFLEKMADQDQRTVYDTEIIDGSRARVTGRASPRGASDDARVQLEYVLERREGDWMVTDVVVDGTSLVASYREQFRGVLAREGIDGLLARMRNRLSSSATD